MSNRRTLVIIEAAIAILLVGAGSLAALSWDSKEQPRSSEVSAEKRNPPSAWISYDYAELGLRLDLPADWQWLGGNGFRAVATSPTGNELYIQRITMQRYADSAKDAAFTAPVGLGIGHAVVDGGGEDAWPNVQVYFLIDSHSAYLLTFFFHKPDAAQSTLFEQHRFIDVYAGILQRIASIASE